jgi:hypothetical protein
MSDSETIRSTFWYRDGVKFECQRCHYCCGGEPGYVWVTEADVRAMAEAIGMDVESFAYEYVRRVGSRYSLKEKPDGFCVMHGEQGCRVYAARPVQCVAYPFWSSVLMSPETWEDEARNCPGMNRGHRHGFDSIRKKIWNNL